MGSFGLRPQDDAGKIVILNVSEESHPQQNPYGHSERQGRIPRNTKNRLLIISNNQQHLWQRNSKRISLPHSPHSPPHSPPSYLVFQNSNPTTTP